MLNALSRVDYGAVIFLEEANENHSESIFSTEGSSNARNFSPSFIHLLQRLLHSKHLTHIPISTRTLHFILTFLGDEDIRVRTGT